MGKMLHLKILNLKCFHVFILAVPFQYFQTLFTGIHYMIINCSPTLE